jgi:hypothetical protein
MAFSISTDPNPLEISLLMWILEDPMAENIHVIDPRPTNPISSSELFSKPSSIT